MHYGYMISEDRPLYGPYEPSMGTNKGGSAKLNCYVAVQDTIREIIAQKMKDSQDCYTRDFNIGRAHINYEAGDKNSGTRAMLTLESETRFFELTRIALSGDTRDICIAFGDPLPGAEGGSGGRGGGGGGGGGGAAGGGGGGGVGSGAGGRANSRGSGDGGDSPDTRGGGGNAAARPYGGGYVVGGAHQRGGGVSPAGGSADRANVLPGDWRDLHHAASEGCAGVSPGGGCAHSADVVPGGGRVAAGDSLPGGVGPDGGGVVYGAVRANRDDLLGCGSTDGDVSGNTGGVQGGGCLGSSDVLSGGVGADSGAGGREAGDRNSFKWGEAVEMHYYCADLIADEPTPRQTSNVLANFLVGAAISLRASCLSSLGVNKQAFGLRAQRERNRCKEDEDDEDELDLDLDYGEADGEHGDDSERRRGRLGAAAQGARYVSTSTGSDPVGGPSSSSTPASAAVDPDTIVALGAGASDSQTRLRCPSGPRGSHPHRLPHYLHPPRLDPTITADMQPRGRSWHG
ncbi:hypothetical protein BDK51DRAFT_37950 [Blyttiomyces helicus]|uniref:Uncharacterized protein n=1 Tax=Blyttiomyces helicus TaxID=388810 RepID=A0A4V1IS74_9FUNG|nr:hypothetical protein BDK51DRAFT_37950 [Blyttiomyces helicus]|eukprot:RKO92567.1 hypothetical protein BDK51DRAFT_37950 [Blyttiomyces helicus]